MSYHFLGSKTTICVAAASEGKHLQSKCCPSPCHFFFLAFIAGHDIIWYRISLWSEWHSCPGYVSSQVLPTSSLLAMRGEGVLWRDSIDTVRALLSSNQNISVLSAPFWLQTQSTALWGPLWGKSTPSQPDSTQSCVPVPSVQLTHWMGFF